MTKANTGTDIIEDMGRRFAEAWKRAAADIVPPGISSYRSGRPDLTGQTRRIVRQAVVGTGLRRGRRSAPK